MAATHQRQPFANDDLAAIGLSCLKGVVEQSMESMRPITPDNAIHCTMTLFTVLHQDRDLMSTSGNEFHSHHIEEVLRRLRAYR